MSDSDQKLESQKPAAASPASAPLPDAPDDAGSQALSEALRSGFAIIQVVMVGLVLLFVFSGFFTVGTQETAVILRFGKLVGTGDKVLLGPGAHWAFPAPIDEVKKIPVSQLQTVVSTIGWYATSAANEASGTEQPPGPSLNPSLDGYVLTGDENIMHVRGSMLYRINPPGLRYAFDFASSSNLVQNAFNNALLYAAASFTVDDALTRDVAGFRDRVKARMEKLVADYQLGITIDQINLQSVPPRQLAKAFAAVLEADVLRSKVLNEARSYENQTVSRAHSEAQSRINLGETERNAMVNSVAAEANRFSVLLGQFNANPTLFTQQRQIETLQKVLTNAQDRIILPKRTGSQPREIRLQLNPDQKPPRPLELPAGEGH